MNDKFGWCFIGAGNIVKRVMPEMHKTNGGYLTSIYSPTYSNAAGIADQYGAKAYKTAEEALSDPNVRAVYIASPHSNHMDSTLTALKAGLPVLCEKPFAVNLAQSQKMIKEAKARNVYLAEGMWTRLNPVFKEVLKWIEDGRIGNVRSFTAELSWKHEFDPKTRLFDYDRAGGFLLDVGVYTVATSRFIFGNKPEHIEALGKLADNGVDTMCAILLGYKTGIARLFTSSETSGAAEPVIYGDKGNIYLKNLYSPTEAKLILNTGEEIQTFAKLNYPDEGFINEFDAVMNDIREGRLENEYITHDYTLEIMETLDTIRSRINLRYKADEE